jgi:hypothetical protein
MRIGLILAGLVIALSILAAPAARTQANDLLIDFSRTLEAGAYTVQITGSATVSPSNRSASGTIHILVTDELGETVAEIDVAFETPESDAASVVVPGTGLVLELVFDAQVGTVGITIVSIWGGRPRAGA